MAVVPVFHADVKPDGSGLTFDGAQRFRRQGYLRTLAGQRVDVIVRPHRERRSDRQNRWWWGVAVPLVAQELGYDKHDHEELHYALVALCFGTHRDEKLGLDVPNARSSALTTAQFSELMEWAVRWAAQQYGIEIPLPGEAEGGLA